MTVCMHAYLKCCVHGFLPPYHCVADGGDEGSVSGDEEDEDDEAVSEVDESEDDGQLYSFSENDDDSVVGEAEASMGSDTEDESDDDNEDNEGEDEQVVSNTKPPQLVSADDDVKKGKAVKHQMGKWLTSLGPSWLFWQL